MKQVVLFGDGRDIETLHVSDTTDNSARADAEGNNVTLALGGPTLQAFVVMGAPRTLQSAQDPAVGSLGIHRIDNPRPFPAPMASFTGTPPALRGHFTWWTMRRPSSSQSAISFFQWCYCGSQG